MVEPLLSVRGLRTEFATDEGTVRAVDGVDFDVMPGEVLGIVGESGCGKSATVKSILGLIEPPGRIRGGSIVLRDGSGGTRDLAALDPRGRAMRAIRGGEIALIPQEPMAAFSPVHTIGNQMIEAIRTHRRVGRRDAFERAVERLGEVGVPDPRGAMGRYAWELSGGLRQRAMIGMALSCDPRLLIADEPTTAIDVTTQAQVLALLSRLRDERGTAIVFITHDLGVIAQLADRVVVMYLGQVMEAAPVDTLFHAPAHPYTRALLRSIPTIGRGGRGGRAPLPTIEGSIPHPFDRPPGCPFFDRCADAMPGTCDRAAPGVTLLDEHPNGSHRASCFLHGAGGELAR